MDTEEINILFNEFYGQLYMNDNSTMYSGKSSYICISLSVNKFGGKKKPFSNKAILPT